MRLGYRAAGRGADQRTGACRHQHTSNTLLVVSSLTNKVTATIRQVGSAPDAVAINPRTRSIYLTDSLGSTVSVLTWPGQA